MNLVVDRAAGPAADQEHLAVLLGDAVAVRVDERVRRVPGGQLGSRRAGAASWLGLGLAKFCKFLAGSFSAVSKRNFARKYAFGSIFQDLQVDYKMCTLCTAAISKVQQKID